MSSNSPNTNIPKTVFEHPDFEKIAGKKAHVISRSRPIIKDSLEISSHENPERIDFCDLYEKLQELKREDKIYYTEEGNDEEIMGFLVDQDEQTINDTYREIAKIIDEECNVSSPIDRITKIQKILSRITEVELITRNEVVVDIRLGGEYEDINEDEKIESDEEKSLPN